MLLPRPGRGGIGGVDGSGAGQRDGEPGQGVDELGGHRPGSGGGAAGDDARCGAWVAAGAGQVGQGAPPGGDAPAGEHAEAERERARACVQGGMTQLLVAGVQPAAGNMSLAGIRARG